MNEAQFSVVLFTSPPPGMTSVEANAAAVKVDGRESLLRAVEMFLNREAIKQIQLCFLPEFAEEGKRKFGGHLGFSGVKVLSAGPKWIDQCVAAAEKLAADATHVVVHDAARCAVPYSDLDALLASAAHAQACCITAPLRAPLLEVDEGAATALHPHSRFVQMLLPMCFSRARFEQLVKDKKEPHASEFVLVKGSALNIRVGGGHDAGLAKAMLSLLPKPKMKAPSTPFEEAQW